MRDAFINTYAQFAHFDRFHNEKSPQRISFGQRGSRILHSIDIECMFICALVRVAAQPFIFNSKVHGFASRQPNCSPHRSVNALHLSCMNFSSYRINKYYSLEFIANEKRRRRETESTEKLVEKCIAKNHWIFALHFAYIESQTR